MYARLAEISLKPEKREEFLDLVRDEFQPLMSRQSGYVDGVGLISDNDQNLGLGVSFWRTRQDAERFYNSDDYRRFMQRIQPWLKGEITVRTFNVETSTYHRIAAGRAA